MIRVLKDISFVLCLMICCFLFCDNVSAESLNFYGSTYSSGLAVTKSQMIEQLPNVNCQEGSGGQYISQGMSVCGYNKLFETLEGRSGVEYKEEVVYKNNKKYTYITVSDYKVSRVDLFYECDKNNSNCSWQPNADMGNIIIYPGMNLVYDVREKLGYDDGTLITEIRVEKPNFWDYNENTKNLLNSFAPISFEIYKHSNEARGWSSVSSMDSSGDYVKDNPNNYGEFQYTIDIHKLLATNNNNNDNLGLGYNGTMYNYLYGQSKGNKQWEFHYLIPIKITTTRVKVEEMMDICSNPTEEVFKNSTLLNACCTSSEEFKNKYPNLCNPCLDYRNKNDKDNYLNTGCCTGTDSSNAPAGWCCKDNNYFKNNKGKCCKEEKSNNYKGLFFPNNLAGKFDEQCCKDQSFFDNGGYKDTCCNKEKETSYKGLYFPDVYAFQYDQKCGTTGGGLDDGAPNCKKESTFNANRQTCCDKEYANGKNGKYLPDGKTYASTCDNPEIKKTCKNSETYFNKHRKSCCDISSYPTGKKSICDNLTDTAALSCSNNESSYSKTLETEINGKCKISMQESIKFTGYNQSNTSALNIESGTGFEYPINVEHKISFDTSTDCDTQDYTENQADSMVRDLNDFINDTTNKINEIDNQKYKFNYKKGTVTSYSYYSDMYSNLNIANFIIPTEFKEIEYDYEYDCSETIGGVTFHKTCTESKNKTVSFPKEESITFEYTLSLPKTYVNKNTGQVSLTEPTSSKEDWYYGGRKFYTEISDQYQYNSFYIYYISDLANLELKLDTDPNKGFICKYLTSPCITRNICNKKEEKGYFYRRISLTNPFPNSNREPGKNWTGMKSGKTLADYYIVDREDEAYTNPMYEITLTSDLINEIRDYNATTDYFDWNMKNQKDKQSTSKFLSAEITSASGDLNKLIKEKMKFRSQDERTEKFGEPNVEVSE